VTLALVSAAFSQVEIAVGGGALGLVGLVLYVVRRVRVGKVSDAIREAAGHAGDRTESFDALATVLEQRCEARWSALVDWEEDGLGGVVRRDRGTGAPPMPALTSWLVREGESDDALLATGGFELGGEGVVVAVPLRRENSALVGFLVLALPRRLRAHAELALVETADELGLALVERPDEQERSAELRLDGLERA
jgi:hypothetical protein